MAENTSNTAGEDLSSHEANENIVHLSPDMLPEGAAPKAGDRLTFVVSGEPDDEGDIPGYFEGGKPEKDEEAQWQDDFRAAMSPSNDQTKG